MIVNDDLKEISIHIDEIFGTSYYFLQWLNSGRDPREFIYDKKVGYTYHILPLRGYCECKECLINVSK